MTHHHMRIVWTAAVIACLFAIASVWWRGVKAWPSVVDAVGKCGWCDR
jgi:hypothetical protein